MQKIIFIICLFISISIFSQNDSIRVKNLKGQIIHADNKKPLSAAHILNLNTVEGTITNDKGIADISDFNQKDILLISHISYTTFNIKFSDLKTQKDVFRKN